MARCCMTRCITCLLYTSTAEATESFSDEKAGTVLRAGRDGIAVQCGSGMLLIKTVQFEGKRMMSVSDYLAGHTIEAGTVLGREE